MTAEAMVTGRMAVQKKEDGNRVLRSLGVNVSQAINQLFDFVIENRALPFPEEHPAQNHTAAELAAAASLVDSICLPANNKFSTMSDLEIKMDRLRSRGLLDE
ncbi:MAG: RelB/DinJ family addiction module antitoxin [Eggerthellaceae bacterium]|nr:RelB/DinJ family addiction module antitoxin [Eggerthellaceae bacterium]